MAKVVFCIPTLTRPYQQAIDSLRDAVPLIEAAGYEHGMVSEIGCPYISAARATMLRKALDAKADIIVFLDHDVSYRPEDMLTLIQTPGDVVAGLYRFKTDDETYMGVLETQGANFSPIVRPDGCIKGQLAPAGFLKVSKEAVERFMTNFPELCYGPKYAQSADLFNHGAYKGSWWGEDYAFSRRWGECGGEIWIPPDLSLIHHDGDKSYPGNYHEFLLRQPGGSNDPERQRAAPIEPPPSGQ